MDKAISNFVHQVYGIQFPYDAEDFETNSITMQEVAKKRIPECRSNEELRVWKKFYNDACKFSEMGISDINTDYGTIYNCLFQYYKRIFYRSIAESPHTIYTHGDVDSFGTLWIAYPRFCTKAVGHGSGTILEFNDNYSMVRVAELWQSVPSRIEKECLKQVFRIVFDDEPEEPAFNHVSTFQG